MTTQWRLALSDISDTNRQESFEANSIYDLVDMFESWGKVQELSEQISGVRAQLIDSRGKLVAGLESLPSFCRLIRSTKLGEHRCNKSYIRNCLSIRSAKKEGIAFTCHAGLLNVAFPLQVNKKPVGAILSGRVLGIKDEVDTKQCRALAQEFGLNVDELTSALSELNKIDPEQFKIFGRLIKPFVDSLGTTMLRYFTLLEKTESLIDAAKESEDLLYVDRLTGLFNERYFVPRLTSEIARAERYKHPISLILMEIDDFDECVSELGHLARDVLLMEIGNIVEKGARKAEVVVRLDEAKFAIILPEADHDKAHKVADRLRKNIALKRFGADAGLSIDLKMSFGIVSLLKNITTDKLRNEAEEMLAKARSEGGNRIRVLPIPETEEKPRRKVPYIASVNGNGHRRRVVITGIGLITPIGIGKEAFWNGIKEGKCGVKNISRFETDDLPVKFAGEINDFDPTDYIDPKSSRRMDRFTQFAVAATKIAADDASLSIQDVNKVGVMLGTNIGGINYAEEQYNLYLEKGPKYLSPFLAIAFSIGSSSSQISLSLGSKGASLTIAAECASGSSAIAGAFDEIQKGDMDIVFAGGAEAPIMPFFIHALDTINLLSCRNDNPEKASRPFDLHRDGLVLGEGAGIVVLEELDHAIKRDASIYAELLSHGTTCDSYHMVHPDPDGHEAARAMKIALENANLTPGDIDYINAHGSSTQLNDAIETRLVKTVFGNHASKVAVSGTKSMTGHAIGATGAIELATTALAVKNDFAPPTISYEKPDPDCDLDYVPNNGRNMPINMAMSNSFGFGGKNTILVLGKYESN